MSSMPEQEVEQEEEPVKKSTILLVREEELASTYRTESWTMLMLTEWRRDPR